MSDEIKALVERASRLLPVVVNMTQDYAELSFGDAHPTQAMTMQPDDWLALNEIVAALTAQADEIERLRVALEWYANSEIYKPSPHGLAFDNRDLSYHARAALKAAQEVKA